MERGSKNKFKMKSSALRAGESIMGRFMAMGKVLGDSKIKPSTAIDPSKYYTAPKKKVVEKPESASKKLKNIKAQAEIDAMDAKISADKAKTTDEDKADAEYYGKEEKSGRWNYASKR